MPRTNPQQSSQEFSKDSTRYAFLSTGRVTTAPTGQSDGAHHVFVQESAAPSDRPLPVLPSVPGDYMVPPEGSPVVVSPVSENQYAVIGAGVPAATSKPSLDPGERIVSHPVSEANIHFNTDGSLTVHDDNGSEIGLAATGDIEIDSNNNVVINGGTNGAITDVNTTKDIDGHVTDVSVVRNDSILL